MSSSKRTFFQARIKVTSAAGTIAQTELFIGLASDQTGTSFFAADGASLTMDDALGFYQLDGDSVLSVTITVNLSANCGCELIQ